MYDLTLVRVIGFKRQRLESLMKENKVWFFFYFCFSLDQGAFSGDTPNWNWRAYLIKRPSISFVPSCSYLKLMDTTTILTSWSWLSLFIERPRVLRWLPSYQWRCPELAGLPHQTTLPLLAYWSLDSLESYLPIQHRWPRIYGLTESLAWRLWHHQRRTQGETELSTVRIYQHPGKWVCELHSENLVWKRAFPSAYRQFYTRRLWFQWEHAKRSRTKRGQLWFV